MNTGQTAALSTPPFALTRPRWFGFPLTLRGLLLLILVLYLVSGPAWHEADIVAAVLGYSLLAVLLALLGCTIFKTLALARKLQLEIAHGDAQHSIDRIESQRLTRIILKLSPFNLLPAYVLTVRIQFEQGEFVLPAHLLTGSLQTHRYVVEDMIFPHRGNWRIEQVQLELGDQLGCTALRWNIPGEALRSAFTVFPPAMGQRTLPIMSSCERAGDMISHLRDRQGDPFDLRQYHPSDGARRILWKVFARKGELISRHPEASMTPEGQVVIFAPALPEEDVTCSSAVSYLRQLEELDLQVFFGCAGMNGARPALSADEAEKLLVDAVWGSKRSASELTAELSGFLAQCSSLVGQGEVRRVLIFTSPRRFETEEDLETMAALGDTLTRTGITPVFIMVATASELPSQNRLSVLTAQYRRSSSPMRFLTRVIVRPRPSPAELWPEYYRSFMNHCARQNWEVTVDQV